MCILTVANVLELLFLHVINISYRMFDFEKELSSIYNIYSLFTGKHKRIPLNHSLPRKDVLDAF